ncbi:DUF4124 domain-containing protein, partial [Methylogaea oryzae]|uniref:DUF4124 domain-containing protein n=1 Tax=Methylogaea oryzae TaxID=1295382 RepID=UPI0012E26A76
MSIAGRFGIILPVRSGTASPPLQGKTQRNEGMTMRNLAMALLLLAGLPALADVYKWKDADGRTHYSDRAAGAVGAER